MSKPSLLRGAHLHAVARNRSVAAVIVGISALQVIVGLLGASLWDCPSALVLSEPCPGCGLTRASMALLRLRWAEMLEIHAFAPALLLSLFVLFLSAILPAAPRQAFLRGLERFERATGVTAVLLIAFVAYWIMRMILDHEGMVVRLSNGAR